MMAICQEREFGWADDKGGICSHKDEGRNSGLWKERETICVGISYGRDYGFPMFGGR